MSVLPTRRIPVATLLLLLPVWAVAQPADEPTTEDWIAREAARAAVDDAFDMYLVPHRDGGERIETAILAAESLIPYGANVVPFLANELEQEKAETFDFCAYSLGRLGVPEAVQPLWDAMERAEASKSRRAPDRKAWVGWALGMLGHEEVLELLGTGNHQSAAYPMHADTTVLEVVAFVNQPESVPILLDMIDRYAGRPELWSPRYLALLSLRRIVAPSSAPTLIRVLGERNRAMRRSALNALARIETEESEKAILSAVDDEDVTVRRSALLALEELRSPPDTDLLEQRLKVEEDFLTRGALYRLLIAAEGRKSIEALRGYLGHPDERERRYLFEAAGNLEGRGAVSFLAEGLSDDDHGVILASVDGLAGLGKPAAERALLDAVDTVPPAILQALVRELVRLGTEGAGEAITRRLTGDILASALEDVGLRAPVEMSGDALVDLGYHEALPALRAVVDRQYDPIVREFVAAAIDDLETIERNGDDVGLWTVTARSDHPRTRKLAYRHLGRIGGEPSVAALASLYEEVEDGPLGLEILRAIGDTGHASSILEQALLDPEYDSQRRLAARDMAAWSARRIGGEEMWELLKRAVERRNGRDARVLNYAAVLDGRRSLPLISAYREKRFEYLGWSRGVEQERLDRLARLIAAGRAINEFDVPPERLRY